MVVVADDIIYAEVAADLCLWYNKRLSAGIRETMFVYTFEIPVVLGILDSLSIDIKVDFYHFLEFFPLSEGTYMNEFKESCYK